MEFGKGQLFDENLKYFSIPCPVHLLELQLQEVDHKHQNVLLVLHNEELSYHAVTSKIIAEYYTMEND